LNLQYVTLQDIEAAAAGLPAVVRRTPLLPCALVPTEIAAERLFLKLENLQVTGAFKVRAAFTVVASLSSQQRKRGIVLASSGNFAQAFALAGRHYGIPITVVMLATTSPYKIDATTALGAQVDLFAGPALARQQRVEELGRLSGMTVIDTWEEPSIVAGHATIGREILQDMPDVEQVLVPVSSGGMAAGVAAAIKLMAPGVRVIGVQPAGANAAWLSMKAGHPVSIDTWSSIADGLSARRPGEYPFSHLQRFLDDIVLVEESDIGAAHVALRRCANVVAEPAGAVAAAAFIAKRIDVARRTVAVVSGGNLTDATLRALESISGLE
jgi:threonine dehydratase